MFWSHRKFKMHLWIFAICLLFFRLLFCEAERVMLSLYRASCGNIFAVVLL